VVAVAAVVHRNVSIDAATDENRRSMSWFIGIRPLGTSAGDHFSPRLPADLKVPTVFRDPPLTSRYFLF
jgi:hypothetical protein